jgi:hypothetical protein
MSCKPKVYCAAVYGTVLSLVILVGVLAFVQRQIKFYDDNRRAGIAGQQLAEITNAAQRYVKDHYQLFTSAVAGGAVVPIPLANLMSGPYLTSTFGNRNSFNQDYLFLLHRQPNGLIELAVLTQNGNPMSDIQASLAASAADQSGVNGAWLLSSDLTRLRSGVGFHPVAAYGGLWTAVEGHVGSLTFFDPNILANANFKPIIELAVNDGQVVQKPLCDSGNVPKIYLSWATGFTGSFSKPIAGFDTAAIPTATTWVISLRLLNEDGNNPTIGGQGKAMARVSCAPGP